MNALIAHIRANMGGLLPYEAAFPSPELTIGDTLLPYSDVYPGASSELPARVWQNGSEEELYSVENKKQRRGNTYLQSPKFNAIPKRSRLPFASRGKSTPPPPLRIHHRMWIGIGAVLRYYQDKGIDISECSRMPLEEKSLEKLFEALDEECESRRAWKINRHSYVHSTSLTDERIDLNLPSCYCEDEIAHLIEMFFFQWRDMLPDYLENTFCDESEEYGRFTKEEISIINDGDWSEIFEVYLKSDSEIKTFGHKELERRVNDFFCVIERHPVLKSLSPEIISEYDVFFSLQEPSDIVAYLDYSEAFDDVIKAMPEWAFEYGSTEAFYQWAKEVLDVYKLETGMTKKDSGTDCSSSEE